MKKKSRRHFGRPALCSLALALSLSVSGCGLSGANLQTGTAEAGTKIYVIGQAGNVQFWDSVEKGALEAGEELGYNVIYRCADNVMEISQQRKFIREAINDDAKSIVIAPNDADALNEDLQAAVDAGIEVITIDSDANFPGRSSYIGSVNSSVAAIAARQAAEFFTDYYNDKALIVSENGATLASNERISGFIPTLISTIRNRASTEYAANIQSAALAELETTDLPAAVINPARSSAMISSAAGAPKESIARAVAEATAGNAKNANIDPEIAAQAAKLAANAYGGDGDLAASLVMENMTGKATTATESDQQTFSHPISDEAIAKINDAAMEAAKEAAKTGTKDDITEAAKRVAVEMTLELGGDPGHAAKAAGQAAGINGGDSMAASSAAAAEVNEALKAEQNNNGEQNGGTAQQEEAQQGNTAAGDVPENVTQAAQSAAKAAAAQNAPPAAIATAAANAAANAAIDSGASPEAAAQAAGQAAGMNGGDAQAAGQAAAEAVAKAAAEKPADEKPEGAGAAAGDIPQELIDAAQTAAKTAKESNAPNAAIEQAAANAAATTAIKIGATPAQAGQAAGQAAGMNGADGAAAGTAAAEMVAKAMNGEGEQQPEEKKEEQTSTIQSGSMLDSIAPVKDILGCNGNVDTAKSEIIKQLSGKDGEHIKVIYTTGELSTLGACQAINDLNLVGKVAIIGYNTNDDELTYLKNGTLSGIIVQNPYNMGYLGVYYAGRLLAGENVGATIDTGATYATLSNLNSNEIQLMLDPAAYTRK